MQSSRVLTECALTAALGAAAGSYLVVHSGAGTALALRATLICGGCFLIFILFGRNASLWRRPLLWVLWSSALLASSAGHALWLQAKTAATLPFGDTVLVEAQVEESCRPSAPPCGFSAKVRIIEAADRAIPHTQKPSEAQFHVRIYLREGDWAPLSGDQFRAKGRFQQAKRALHPYAFDAHTWSLRRGYDASFQLTELPHIHGVHRSLARQLGARRARMEYAMQRHGRPDAAGVLVAMSTGTKSGLSDEVRARFAASGTAHVLAVSGLHLGLLAGALWWSLSRIFSFFPSLLRRWNADALSAMLTLPVLGLYVIFTGMPTSAMRAGLMACALFIPRIFSRRGSSLHGLSLAVLVLLCFHPLLIVDLGFQLSVAATLSLVLLARQLRKAPDSPEENETVEEDEAPLAFHFGDADRGVYLLDHGSEGDEGDDNTRTEQAVIPPQAADASQGSAAPKPPTGRGLQHELSVLIGWTTDEGEEAQERSWFHRILAGMWTATEVSLVSTLATAPFLVWHFGGLPLLSPLPNLLIVPPLSILALPLGAIGASLDVYSPWLGGLLVQVSLQIIEWCLTLARWGAAIFEVELLLGRPHGVGVIGWALLALASPFLFRGWQGKWWCVAMIGSLLIGGDYLHRQPARGALELHAIPVGQGDATWLRFPNGTTMLIDAGGHGFGVSRTGTQYVLPYLRAHGVAKVDILVATHGHADHIAGITELVPLIRPSQVWVGNHDLQRPMESELYLAAKRAGARYAQPHFLWEAVDIGDVRLEILPVDGLDASNDGSLAMRLCYRDFCALLTGDIEARREAFLVEHHVPIQAQYLKVGHHGSKTSTGPAFLRRVQPQVAVIHLGPDNRFAFPHTDVRTRLQRFPAEIWRTDRGESVVHATDGTRLWRVQRHRLPRLNHLLRSPSKAREATTNEMEPAKDRASAH